MKPCPRCIGGKMFLDWILGKWAWWCLNCGFVKDVGKGK